MLALIMVALSMVFTGKTSTFLDTFLASLVVSNTIGYLIHATLELAEWLLGGWPRRARGVPRLLYYVCVVATCVMAGLLIGTALVRGVNPLKYLASAAMLAPLLPFALLVALFMFVVFMTGEKRINSETLAARQSEQLASAAQLLAEARLHALQAQIEPHFLYNTLANVVGLIDTEPAQARHMLERFIDYLRASLAASRAASGTLGAELDMVAAYLDVLAVRMGPRLRYRFDIAAGCREILIAPMLIQPVIENAVAHGLEPQVEGGEICVRAVVQGAHLCIEVSDTGAGLGSTAPKPGGGVGLSNLRARLRSMYDGQAQVQLLENQPCGITVRLLLPLKETLTSTIPGP